MRLSPVNAARSSQSDGCEGKVPRYSAHMWLMVAGLSWLGNTRSCWKGRGGEALGDSCVCNKRENTPGTLSQRQLHRKKLLPPPKS